MIIQIKCTASKQWHNRTSCTKVEAKGEMEALKKIYRFNEFRLIKNNGTKYPGPIYHRKTKQQIEDIIADIDSQIKKRTRAVNMYKNIVNK